ncbi:MAG: helix-turn-helix domain-containing protein [Acidiferrobacterales bacterium]|nr:helix-turn-helix domain-containing protein [Acidiferrobacterales bacterium]
MTDSGSSSTIDKAIHILLHLSHENGEVGTTDLGRKLGFHKANVSRLLIKLAEYNFVYKNKQNRKYG